jgi:hypothetical protein
MIVCKIGYLGKWGICDLISITLFYGYLSYFKKVGMHSNGCFIIHDLMFFTARLIRYQNPIGEQFKIVLYFPISLLNDQMKVTVRYFP